MDIQTHTLVLMQRTNKLSSRMFYDYESVYAAMEGIIALFEEKLKNERAKVETLKYTENDVEAFIDDLADVVCLIREELSPGVYGYAPKNAAWLKQFIRPVLARKAAALAKIHGGAPSSSNARASFGTRMDHGAPGGGGRGGAGGPRKGGNGNGHGNGNKAATDGDINKRLGNKGGNKKANAEPGIFVVPSTIGKGVSKRKGGNKGNAAVDLSGKGGVQLMTQAYAQKMNLVGNGASLAGGNRGNGNGGGGGKGKKRH
ncbi:hypothetical protein H9P43_009843 [Blastocladiella emersonii ATCC 22665]|nr:hypothetical protein H9P43_009843 [Blastocladiella emersonii ATCC 22665]